MNQPLDRLYNLLPAIYRLRDTAEGEPLRALLAAVEGELRLIESDISNLYENWFIETCDEWVVPYIGDLLSTQELYGGNPRAYGQQQRRAYVANTLAYRRRKGTVTVLEQLVRDVTDWRARAVEFYKLLATTQNISHIRPEITTVDLRSNRQPEQVGSPFEQRVAYTVEVRRAASGSNLDVGQSRGRYNVRHVGLFVWRLQSYPIQRSLARSVAGGETQPTGRYYTFNPLGYDKAPLFNQPQTETDILHLAEEINLPVSLRRSVLSRELEARHRQQLQGLNWQGLGYFADNPVLQVYLDGQPQPLPPEGIQIRQLKNDNAEDANDWVSVVSDESEHRCDWKPLPAVVALDPETGRLAILGSNLPKKVEVSYLYGFSGDVGGGMYNREQVASSSTVGVPPIAQEFAQLVPPLMWQVKQAESAVTNPLAAAVKAWNQTVQAWQDLREHIAIPLAKIMIPPTRVSRVTGNPKLPSRPRFTPGVVKGLTVRINRQRAVAIVNPGIAVDGQGRRIHLDTVQEINLNGILQRSQSSLEPQRFLLVASFLTIPGEQSQSPSPPQSIPIGIIPETALEAYPPGTFIPLQRLEVAEGSLVETTAIAPQMSAGIVSGLEVLAPHGKIEVMVTSGTAVDRRGRVIVLVTNQAIDLRAYPKQRGSLVLAIARRRNKRNWQIKFIPEAEPSNHENHRQEHIHLASLDIPNLEATLIPLSRLIQGLEVVPQPGMLAVHVTPGKAIDSRGEAIALHSESGTIDLMPYRGKTVQLVLFTGADRRYPRGTLRVIQPGEVERVVKLIDQDMELDTYIVLANLYLTPEFLSGQADETEQPPWLRPVGRVVDGLSVQSSPQTPARMTVQPGEAIDGEQRTIHLESDCHFDLSSCAGRTLILFMSHQWGQGLPDLTCVSPSLGSGWKQIGVVPEESWTADTGTIVIGDNGTYRGSLSITVPSDRKLQIIAANGCRPHIRGNLDIQGTSTMDNVFFNTLTVDGLLVEGLLTVLPGRLKHLQVRHCTILSKAGGLVVQRQVVSEELEEAEDSITLLALIMYCLTLIQRLLRLGMGLEHPSPKQNLAQLARLGFQEFLQLTDAIQKAVDYWWASECSDDVEDDLDENSQEGDRSSPENDEAGDNERLEIDIKQTICGAIALADTVAHLAIADSIIDAGYGKPTGSGNDGGVAITASGTAVDISTTTVFGRVAVRRLEASNSIFTAKVTALRQQVGCMRFCHTPEGSRTPTRYLCQPERALLETLNILPEKITAFAIAKHPVSVIASTPNSPDTSQAINPVFTSTGGGRVFYCNTHNNGNQNKQDEWEKTQNQPSNLNVTALLAYFNGAGTLILWAGTAGGGLFRSENQGEFWQSVSSGFGTNKLISKHTSIKLKCWT
jgi:hypothetical protein